MAYGKVEVAIGGRTFTGRIKEHRRFRRQIFSRDNFTCRACGIAPDCIPADWDGRYTLMVSSHPGGLRWLELDHITPITRGGKLTACNTQTLCNICNSQKGTGGSIGIR